METSKNDRILFSWLHLSDIHMLHGDEEYHADQDLILNALTNEISNSIQQQRVPSPDAIFVTGDIASTGATRYENEYELAKNWLDQISEATSLSRDETFLIPGNHDVQRNVYENNDTAAMILDLLRDNKRKLEWALKKYSSELESRFSNYLDFAQNYAPLCLPKYESNNQRLF